MKRRNSQQGVALVITLILLSVITFMAVTFLVVSRHEGEQVNTLTQQNNAKFASAAAAELAQGQIAGLMLGQGNGLNFGLLVSTNFQSPYYTNGVGSLLNVNYAYQNGQPLNQADQLQMLNNLQYLPRPPVYISTNKLVTPEFRFFLDLNRNGRFDTNGLVMELDDQGNPVLDTSSPARPPLFNWHVGDPEWVGFLDHPDQRHSGSNLFVARGAFIALPIGNSLDLNAIHNQAKLLPVPNPQTIASDSFLRDEGVGSWEINLAGFLSGLNTNYWGSNNYAYSSLVNGGASTFASTGNAFYDAAAIVQYRYNGGYFNLSTFAGNPYGPNASFSFNNDMIDGYGAGFGPSGGFRYLLTGIWPTTVDGDASLYNRNGWSGSDNPNSFFTTQDLFSSAPLLNTFSNNLYSAGTNRSTYNRYTFYRLLSQMGFNSAPEPSPYPASRKMHLNYNNLTSAATGFTPWTPVQFFTNCADRLLRAQPELATNGISITNIPVYPTNLYTPAVHRLLQLAANIYDASTSKTNNGTSFDYPSVFRPIFTKTVAGTNTLVYISGYYEVSNNVSAYLAKPLDLRAPGAVNLLQSVDSLNNIYGVPYVIGARLVGTNGLGLGYPSFNKFSVGPVVQMQRKLQIVKRQQNDPPALWHTNVQYEIGISNVVGVECWNSYTNFYGRNVRILATNEMTAVLTNNFGYPPIFLNVTNNNVTIDASFDPPYLTANTWSGSPNLGNYIAASNSFVRPLLTNAVVLQNSVIRQNPPLPVPVVNFGGSIPFETTTGYFLPHWGITVTNRLRVIMQDMPNGMAGAPGRLIDYVQLNGMDFADDITADLAQLTLPSSGSGSPIVVSSGIGIWMTNTVSSNNPAPVGFLNQLAISSGNLSVPLSVWNSAPGNSPQSPNSIQIAQTQFRNFINGASSNLTAQVPFVAYAKYAKTYTWSANDPLVHYTTGDLTDLTQSTNAPKDFSASTNTTTYGFLTDLGKLSLRYLPWGTNSNHPRLRSIRTNELAFKDPLIRQSANWQFPTNKYPNIGWLGRVHRGTPWQTVYLKSSPAYDTNAWQYWTGDPNVFDAAISQPTNDWKILDLFTTAPNDNASRGQLSVNQTNLAAWAAVLDGVITLTNTATNVAPWVIDPANTYMYPGTPSYLTNSVQYIVSSINAWRALTNYPGQVFTHVGDILTVPQLTVLSPFINPANVNTLSDAVYERIPQQIASLLRVGSPRYVIFAYGQSLKPADRSIVQSGPYFGMCTNYQITGEVLTRTVVRFDNAPIPGGLVPGTPGTLNPPFFTNVPPVRAVVESFNVLGPE